MLSVAVYGKGGIGKSFVASNLAVHWALSGRRVVLVGCDPKGDSSRNLAPGAGPPSALERLIDPVRRPGRVDELIVRSPQGVDCIEAGGPEPGEGCGGMGILKLFQFLNREGFQADVRFDVRVYDVLGDVVCGGFVAPMKFAAPLLVVVVVSDDVHSLYAANQVARAVQRYEQAGVRLAGVVVNSSTGGGRAARFARGISAEVLAEIPRIAAVSDADARRVPAILHEQASALARPIASLAAALDRSDISTLQKVTPLAPAQFDAVMSDTEV